MSFHSSFIAKLQKDNHWHVEHDSSQIKLSKIIAGKAVSIMLERQKNETYALSPVKNLFQSTTSHYDYAVPEERWIRNKGIFNNFVRTIKRVGMHEFIDWSTFIKVNANNPNSDKKVVRAQLASLLLKN